MAVQRIDSKRLFEDKITAGIVKDMDALVKKSDETTKAILKTVDALKQIKDVKSAKDLRNFTEQTKKLTDAQKQRQKNQQTGIVIAKKIETQSKRLKIANSDKIQQVVELTRLTKEQNAINKDTEILNNKRAGTLEKLAASSRKLRREREKLNLNSDKGKKRLIEINKELDKNNKIILKNSDSLKKQKINAGNYKDSIKEAATESGLFSGILGKLTAVQKTLAALTKKNVVAEEADIVAKQGQAVATGNLTVAQRGLTLATGGGVKALKAFKIALASSGIGAILLGLGALIAFFKRSQDGVDALNTGIAGLGTALDVFIDRLSQIGRGIVQIFTGIGDSFKAAGIQAKIFFLEVAGILVDNTAQIAALRAELEGLGGISEGIQTIKDAFKGIGDELAREVALATQLKKLTIELTREQKLFEAQQASSLTQAKELNLISRDKLKSDQERVNALKEANRIEVATAKEQLILQEAALAASLDSISADQQSLQLGAEQLEFINAIKEGRIEAAAAVQQAADFTLSSAAGEEALFEIVDKIVAQEQAKQSLLDKQATTIKKLSSLQVQIATKNATAEQQKAAFQRELFKDEDLQLEKRIEAIEKARDFDIAGNKFRLDANIINEAEFLARKLTLAKKTEEEIQKLLDKNKKADVDFEAIARKQVELVNQIEQELLQQDIERLQRRLEIEELSLTERLRIIDELFDTQNTKAQAQADFLVLLEGKTAEEIELINLKKAKALEDIENARVDAVKEANKEIVKDDEKTNKERVDNAVKFSNEVFNSLKTQLAKQNQAFNEALNNEIQSLQESIDRQLESNREGGEQKLADDQALLAKRELERKRALEAQAKQERLIALSQQFVNSAAAFAKDDPEGAIVKALVQTFAAEGIAKVIAGFAEGGYTGDGDKYEVAGAVHKGENVNTAKQVTKYGMKGWSARDFDKKISEGYFNQFATNNINLPEHIYKNIDVGGMTPAAFDSSSINKGQKDAANQIEKAIRGEAVDSKIFLDQLGQVVTSLTKGGVTEKIIYERDPETH